MGWKGHAPKPLTARAFETILNLPGCRHQANKFFAVSSIFDLGVLMANKSVLECCEGEFSKLFLDFISRDRCIIDC